ncbi:unnamed protein product [Paramecium pentaurelia]|uniref:Uncharacterized protein n=1 Tax=Paramecium pentaurelia TaxID=43138 RepID=A0A8S1TDE7_9CILI|nr:unnamed protein product [Paramecium pentaurelia]
MNEYFMQFQNYKKGFNQEKRLQIKLSKQSKEKINKNYHMKQIFIITDSLLQKHFSMPLLLVFY